MNNLNNLEKTKILFVSNVSFNDKTGQSAFVRNVYDEFIKFEFFSTKFIGIDIFPKFFLLNKFTSILFKTFVFQFLLLFYYLRFRKSHVCVFSFKPYMWSVIFLKIFRVRYIVLIEGLMPKTVDRLFPSWFQSIFNHLSKVVFYNAIGAICAYKSAADWVHSINDELNIDVVPCGLKELDIQSKDRIVYDLCYVGSFRDVHRIDILLDFAEAYHLSIIFLGVGSQKEDIESQCELRKIKSKFIGFVDSSDLPFYIGMAKVGWGIIDSSHWGVPMKVLDYVASGRPAITNSFHFFDLNESGNVEIVNSLDVTDIYLAFTLCVENNISFDFAKLTEQYSWKNYCNVAQKIISTNDIV